MAPPVSDAASIDAAPALPTVPQFSGRPTTYFTPATLLAADAAARVAGYRKTLDPMTLQRMSFGQRHPEAYKSKYPVIAMRPFVLAADGRESVFVCCLVATSDMQGRTIDVDADNYLALPQDRFEHLNPWVCDPEWLMELSGPQVDSKPQAVN